MAVDTKSKLSQADIEQARQTAEEDNRAADIEQLEKSYREPAYSPPHEEPTPQENSEPGYGWQQDQEEKDEQKQSWKERYKDYKDKYEKIKKAKKEISKTAKKTEKQAIKQGEKQVIKQAGKEAAKAGTKTAARVGAQTAARGAAAATGPETAGVTVVAEKLIEEDIKRYSQRLKDFKHLEKLQLEKIAQEHLKNKLKKKKKYLFLIAIIIIGFFALMMLVATLFEQMMTERYAKYLVSQLTTKEAILLQLVKEGPTTAAAGSLLRYTINAAYNGAAEDIIVTDKIPIGTTFFIATQPYAYDPITRTVTWHTKETNPSNPSTATLILSLTANVNNNYIINIARGTAIAAAGTANNNNCGGKYTSDLAKNWLFPLNFGDPACDFNKQDLRDLLHKLDPVNEAWWYTHVIPCESGYNPNIWRDPNIITHTPDAGGAWGLFQIGSSTIMEPESLYSNHSNRRNVTKADVVQQPGLAAGIWGHGKEYDRGDVDWRLQVEYAVNLLKSRGRSYWACR